MRSCCPSLYASVQNASLPLSTQGEAEQCEKLLEAQSNTTLQLQFITAEKYAEECLLHEARRAANDLHSECICELGIFVGLQ